MITLTEVLSVTNIAALISIIIVMVRLIRAHTRMEIRVDMMWADFRARLPFARRSDHEEEE